MTLPQALRAELLAGIEVIVGVDGKQCWLWAHHLALVTHEDTLMRLRGRPWHNR
jgi:hypothetical protein